MAWRPTQYLIEGELDNTRPGSVTGWLLFAGMTGRVHMALKGDFHRDIRGKSVRLCGEGRESPAAQKYMEGFAGMQFGTVGDMTAGGEPRAYVDYGYFEWYSVANGRVVLELYPEQVQILADEPVATSKADTGAQPF